MNHNATDALHAAGRTCRHVVSILSGLLLIYRPFRKGGWSRAALN